MVQGNIQHPETASTKFSIQSSAAQSQRSRQSNAVPRSSSNGGLSDKQMSSVSQRTTTTVKNEIERLKTELAREKKLRQEVETKLKRAHK